MAPDLSMLICAGRARSVQSVRNSPSGLEKLHAAVLAVGDEDRALAVDGDAVRDMKLSGTAPRLSPREQQAAVRRKLVNAGVAIPVADVDVPVGGESHVRREMERRPRVADRAVIDACGTSLRRAAGRAERQQQFAVRRELANGVVGVIGAVDRIVGTDQDSVRARLNRPSPQEPWKEPSGPNTITGCSPRLKTYTRSRESVATATASIQPQPGGTFAH